MFKFLRGLFAGVARGLGWLMHQAIALPIDLAEGLFTALWRQLCPPPVQEEESTADVLRQVAGMIAGQSGAADQKAETERPARRPLSEAAIKRSMEQALWYTTAMLHGEPLPSLAHVQPELCHELRALNCTDAEVMHRRLIAALDIEGPGWWDGPQREVTAPGPEHEPVLRYA